MDENQNQEIDFSSQPLGLMAQEGAQIEEHLENEMRLNEAQHNKPQEGENPFEGIDFGAAKKEPVPSMMNQQEQPTVELKKDEPQMLLKPEPQPQEIISLNSSPEPNSEVNQFDKSEINNGFGENLKPQDQMNEEDLRKQAIMDELNREKSEFSKEDYNEEKPSFLGIVGALVLFAVFGFAIFIFTSGKLDSFLDKHKKDDTVEIEATGDEEETEEKAEEEKKPEEVLNTLKNYKANESIFIVSEGISMSIKLEGIFDLEHQVYIGRQIVATGGRSANLKVYTDIEKKIYYYEDTSVTPPVWRKTPTTVTDNINIDKRLKILQENGDFKEKETNHFIGTINSTLLADVLGTRVDQSLLKSGDIEVDFTLENGRIRKIKYNFTSVTDESIDTLIYSAEFYDVNANGPQSIPEEIVLKAQSV